MVGAAGLLTVISMYRRLVEVMAGRSRVPGEGATGAKVGDRLSGADLEGSVVFPGFVAEVGDACVVGRREHEGLFGED